MVGEFDVELVVIGGGLSAAFDRFGPAIQSHLDVPVRPIALGAAGPILGAVHLTWSIATTVDERVRRQVGRSLIAFISPDDR